MSGCDVFPTKPWDAGGQGACQGRNVPVGHAKALRYQVRRKPVLVLDRLLSAEGSP